MDFLYLIFGVAGLWIGAELTIGGALKLAKQHSLSDFFVGLAILSVGSDLPELAIAIDTGIKNSLGGNVSGIVVGTSIGSVAGQLGFVLGVTGLIGSVLLPRRYIFRHGAVMLGALIVLFLTSFDGVVNRVEGITLITLYLIYVFSLLRGENLRGERPEPHVQPLANPWFVVALGLFVTIGSSELTVQSVISLASRLQISEAFISVVVLGLGSSLPELSISVSAIVKKKIRLSMGNIIGSSILDTLLPIGTAAVISPVFFGREFQLLDLPYIFMLGLITLFFFAKQRGLQKIEAGVILGLYLFYLLIKFLQQ